MRAKNVLWAIVFFLLLLNTATLVFLVSERRPPHRGNGFDELVVRTLQLDEHQQQQFDMLKRKHHEQILDIDGAMHRLFTEYFSLLDQGAAGASAKDSLERLLAAAYDQKVKVTYAHFLELKMICRPEQQARFHELWPELMQVISPPDKKRRPGTEGN